MKQIQQPKYPYFHTAGNNNVTAVYVVHPELLATDDETQRGRPFLFYTGSCHKDITGRQIEEGSGAGLFPYVGKKADLAELLNGKTDKWTAEWLGIKEADQKYEGLPKSVKINNEEVLTEKLSSGYVPFSFGVGHEYDCQRFNETNGRNVRLDFDGFKQALAGFDAKKEAENQRRAQYESTLGYKVRSFLRLE